MLKSYDIRVKSNHSDNWYDSFQVDTSRGVVTFNQCDARRGGQVARYFAITFNKKDGKALITAKSANNTRSETFGTTQCLRLALRLLDEARSEEKQAKGISIPSHEESESIILGTAFALISLIPVFFLITMGVEAYADATRIGVLATTATLAIAFFYKAYVLKKEREE